MVVVMMMIITVCSNPAANCNQSPLCRVSCKQQLQCTFNTLTALATLSNFVDFTATAEHFDCTATVPLMHCCSAFCQFYQNFAHFHINDQHPRQQVFVVGLRVESLVGPWGCVHSWLGLWGCAAHLCVNLLHFCCIVCNSTDSNLKYCSMAA